MDQDLMKQVHDLGEAIREINDKISVKSEKDERVERLQEEVGRLSDELRASDARRKGQYNEVDAEKVLRTQPRGGLNKLLRTRSDAPEIRQFHEHADNLYILGNMMHTDPRNTDYYKDVCEHNII